MVRGGRSSLKEGESSLPGERVVSLGPEERGCDVAVATIVDAGFMNSEGIYSQRAPTIIGGCLRCGRGRTHPYYTGGEPLVIVTKRNLHPSVKTEFHQGQGILFFLPWGQESLTHPCIFLKKRAEDTFDSCPSGQVKERQQQSYLSFWYRRNSPGDSFRAVDFHQRLEER